MMDEETRQALVAQRADEIASPLILVMAERLDLNLGANDGLGVRLMADLVSRVFAAGMDHGIIEMMAHVVEQLPEDAVIGVNYRSPEFPPPETLGENISID